MLKALIKKQFCECFRTYFVNVKTGKARSRAGIVGMFVFFAVLMLFLCSVFFGMAFLLGGLFDAGLAWLYYALMGVVSIALGTFGSVFSTFSTLYMARDNELLLSMPIPPAKIIITRVTLVYGLSLLYSGTVWLPAIVYSWLFAAPGALSVVFGLLLCPVIALFVTVLTCALGWVVALIAARVKKKSFLTVVLSLVFFGLYYFVCFRMSHFMETLIANSAAVGQGLKTWGNLLYQLGRAADGGIVAMVIFTGVTLALFALCFFALSRSFAHIVTKTPTVGKSEVRVSAGKVQDVRSALFRRELKRFTASATYMLNCGLQIAILPVLAVLAVIKRHELQSLVVAFSGMIPEVQTLLPLIVLLAVCLILSIGVITTPSISLEGRQLWILRTLPVTGREVLAAKLRLHVTLNVCPAVLAVVVMGWCVAIDWQTLVFMAVFAYVFLWILGAIGLILGLKRPNFNWTVETMPIKQSMNVMFCWLAGWVLIAIVCLGGYLLRSTVSIATYIPVTIAVLVLAARALKHWLDTEGAALFDSL